MRHVLSVSALLVFLAADVASAEQPQGQAARPGWTLATESPWTNLEAERIEPPRPITLVAPYCDYRVVPCAGANCDVGAVGALPPPPPPCPTIIDMSAYQPPRGYSPSADFGNRVQAVTGCAVVSDTLPAIPVTGAILPHPVAPPPQPFITRSLGINQFGEEGGEVVAWRQPVFACGSVVPGAPACNCPPPSCAPPPAPSYAAPPVIYAPPVYTAAVPGPFGHPAAVYPNPPCCAAGCDCGVKSSYNPQVVYPTSQCACEPGAATSGDCCNRIEHILEAVHHLEAAGLQADADRLRHQCDTEMKSIVERLKKAEAELAELRSASQEATHCECTIGCVRTDRAAGECKSAETKQVETSSPQKQVLVRVELLEVNRTKCRELGIELPKNLANVLGGEAELAGGLIPADSKDSVRFAGVDRSNVLFKLVKALKEQDVVKVLTNPSVCTLSGRPVHLHCGGEFPVLGENLNVIEYRKVGTEIDCLPVVRDNGDLRLDIRTRLAQLDPMLSATLKNVPPQLSTVPGLKVREFDTAADLKPGQALVICGPSETRGTGIGVEFPPAVLRGLYSSPISKMPWFELVHENFIQPFCRTEHRVEEEEIELVAIVRPEVLDTDAPLAHTLRSHPVEPAGWTAVEEKPCNAPPACCDEGPACKCESSGCSEYGSCGQSWSESNRSTVEMSETKSIFAPRGLERPFEPQLIHVNPVSFDLPAACPVHPSLDLDFQFEYGSSGEPKCVTPARFTQPVVAPVQEVLR